MMKSRYLLLVPLVAGALILDKPAIESPGVEKRPASFSPAADPDQGIDVAVAAASIDVPEVKNLFLETVVAQGTTGEKKKAIRELRRDGSAEAVRILSFALGDEDSRVRQAALESLAHIGGDDALAVIASLSGDKDPVLRADAAMSLGEAGGDSAARYLEIVLRDDDPRVRESALMALSDLGDSQSINIISVALRDPDPEVRQRAAELLDELSDDALFATLFPPE